MRKIAVCLALSIAAGAFLTTAPSRAAETVRVTFIPIVDTLPLFVAKDEGFFEKRGLDVTLTAVPNQGVVISSLVSGSAEVGNTVAPSMLQAKDAGIDLVIVAGAASFPIPTPRNVGVVARTGSGIETPKDLVGKQVAVAGLGSFHQVMVQRWLEEKGVDYKKVNFVEAAFPLQPDILRAGKVDAVVSVDPFYNRMIDSKIGYVVGDFMGGVPDGTIIDFYVTNRGWAQAHPKAVQAFHDALDDARRFIEANDAGARESLARWTKQPAAVLAATVIPTFRGDISGKQVDFWVQLLKKQGMLQSSPSGADLIFKP
jgi:NitT/TauT family transport system substrate-binding protein